MGHDFKTQMALARSGVISDTMTRAAEREGLDPDQVRQELPAGQWPRCRSAERFKRSSVDMPS